MSLASCYRYVLELPVDTLNKLLRGALSESDPAGIKISQERQDVAIGTHTADVGIRPDVDGAPPNVELGAAPNSLVLHLAMRVEIEVTDIPGLDPIVYRVGFSLPGVLEKSTETPPRLLARFPTVTAASLNLTLQGGEIVLTPALIEPRIHEMYDAHPELGHTVQTGQSWPPDNIGDPPKTATVTVDIFDDPMKGEITVDVPSTTKIVIHMPGHFLVISVDGEEMDTDMTVDVSVTVVQDLAGGKVTVMLSTLTSSDVAVTFVTPHPNPIVNQAASTILAGRIASTIKTFPNIEETFPTQAQVKDLIGAEIVTLAKALQIPVFTPPAPAGPGEIDLTTFVSTTLAQKILALQIEPRNDGTACDDPDEFARTTGFSISAAAVVVDASIQKLITANNGTTREMQGYPVTISDLTAALSDPGENSQSSGHIWITGLATAEVDCWEDAEVNFWGAVFLKPRMDADGTLFVSADAGGFGADDPCCADVDPDDIAAEIEGDEERIAKLPPKFTNIGDLKMTADECVISKAGIIIHGSLELATNQALNASALEKTLYWFNEPAGGG